MKRTKKSSPQPTQPIESDDDAYQREHNAAMAEAHERHRKQHRRAVIALVVSLITLLVVAVALFMLWPSLLSSKPVDAEADKKLSEVLTEATTTPDRATISSGLGFSMSYDKNRFEAYGYVSDTTESRPGYASGEDFTNDELATPRNYTMIRFTSKEALATAGKGNSFKVPYLIGLTNFHKSFFDNSRLNSQYASMSDLDILLDKDKVQTTEDGDTTVKSVQKLTVNDREFYKVVYESSYTLLDTTVYSWSYHYLTVNDGSPYWFSINNVKDASLDLVPQYEALISDVTFGTHDDGSLVRAKSAGVLATTSATHSPEKSSLQEGYVNSSDAVDIIARNQIATVRVGTIRCADLTLTASNQTTTILRDSCTAGIGSGSIVSSDGYIVTNGHVAYVPERALLYQGAAKTPDTITALLAYTRDSGIATVEQLQEYVDQIRAGSNQAYDALIAAVVNGSTITTSDDIYSYDIQTSDAPMRIDESGTRLQWMQEPGNKIGGTLVDYEYDTTISYFDPTSVKSDVAIIKIDGTFPTVRLGSLDSVAEGDTITTLGYPAIVDDGVDTKSSSTLPTASQGDVEAVMVDGGQHQLVYSSAQIASGNSGGPAFDDSGDQVGINTYGGTSCSDEHASGCFGNALTRDAADAKSLLDKNSITLQSGELTTLWNRAIDSYRAGEYGVAAGILQELDKKYPDNYMLTTLKASAIAAAESSGQTVTSSTPLLGSSTGIGNVIIIVAVVVLIVLLLVIIVAIIIIVRSRRHPYYQVPAGYAPAQTQQYYQPQQPYQPQPTPPAAYPQPVQPQQYPAQNPPQTTAPPAQPSDQPPTPPPNPYV